MNECICYELRSLYDKHLLILCIRFIEKEENRIVPF